MQKIVLTGNIGSGKSTIIRVFQKYNVSIFDADACIRDIYKNNHDFKQQLAQINPEFIVDNQILKPKIIAYLHASPAFIDTLESLLYPILAIKRQEFIDMHQKNNHIMTVFEVPLLFEKNLQNNYDAIILVYAPYHIRLGRALLREGMTKEKFDFMNNRQINYTQLLDTVTLAIDTTQPIQECEHLVINKFFNNTPSRLNTL
jgi:dephospho-CoA kinase